MAPRVKSASVFNRRTAGCLLHPTSLPSLPLAGLEVPFGNIGKGAYQFIDFLHASDLRVWQMLPTGPTHDDGSPYQSWSAHAGSPRLICLRTLCEWGWLDEKRIASLLTPCREITEATLAQAREAACTQFYEFIESPGGRKVASDFSNFMEEERAWLDDFSLFLAIRKAEQGKAWLHWPDGLKKRDPVALEKARVDYSNYIRQAYFEQFAFYSEWKALKQYAAKKNVLLFGDIPIFVALDSADVWANPEQFMLDEECNPISVAGVPPDYFSETGQHWGNPHYHWQTMQDDGFEWWCERVERQLKQYDLIRIDHFRGLEAYWSIPANSVDARTGQWIKAPGEALLNRLFERFHNLPIVAENLGLITLEVEQLRKQFLLPGMVVLQFGFDGQSQNINALHYHEPLNVVYTGTHDNDTTRGWLQAIGKEQTEFAKNYVNAQSSALTTWGLVKAALGSVARMAVVPMQDWLNLDNTARMNTPGTAEGNWHWRFNWTDVPADLPERIKREVHIYDRLGNELPFLTDDV